MELFNKGYGFYRAGLATAKDRFAQALGKVMARGNGVFFDGHIMREGVIYTRITKKQRPTGTSFTKKGPGRRPITGPFYKVA